MALVPGARAKAMADDYARAKASRKSQSVNAQIAG
jgi:hypothetical protein